LKLSRSVNRIDPSGSVTRPQGTAVLVVTGRTAQIGPGPTPQGSGTITRTGALGTDSSPAASSDVTVSVCTVPADSPHTVAGGAGTLATSRPSTYTWYPTMPPTPPADGSQVTVTQPAPAWATRTFAGADGGCGSGHVGRVTRSVSLGAEKLPTASTATMVSPNDRPGVSPVSTVPVTFPGTSLSSCPSANSA
jgi:hypothetical protein